MTRRTLHGGALAALIALAGCDAAGPDSSADAAAAAARPDRSSAGAPDESSSCSAPYSVTGGPYTAAVDLVQLTINQFSGGGDPPILEEMRPGQVVAGQVGPARTLPDGSEIVTVASGTASGRMATFSYRINRQVRPPGGSVYYPASYVTLGTPSGTNGATFIDYDWDWGYSANPFNRYHARYKVNRVCSESPYVASPDVIVAFWVQPVS